MLIKIREKSGGWVAKIILGVLVVAFAVFFGFGHNEIRCESFIVRYFDAVGDRVIVGVGGSFPCEECRYP